MSDQGPSTEARAHSLARALLDLKPNRELTPDDLANTVMTVAAALAQSEETFDHDRLLRRLESEISVFLGDAEVITDPDEDHRPWLDDRRADIAWGFWEAYRAYNRDRLPGSVVDGLDRMTDDILDLLEDPERPGTWDRRGMVVGQVQSGKTANYTGVICKAADAGYKFIVVLAGLHNSLRSQTQQRLDEGFLGLDSRTSEAFKATNRRIGVGDMAHRHPVAMTLTSSDELGDFSKQVASRIAGQIGSTPVILVVKKNKAILQHLIDWVTQMNGVKDPASGRMVVRDFPLLVIDDEADNASVNTKKIEYEVADGDVREQSDPSAINRQIRTLLHAFDRSALLSYTATPFANIFIDGEEPHDKYGEDLFPRSFILRIPAPSNYIGAAQVFGLPAADEPDDQPRAGLPVLRPIADSEDWLRLGHKKDESPGKMPASLRQAMRAFVLVVAARAARGQVKVHNSMLVHVTRFVDVQHLVYEQVQRELDALRNDLVYGERTQGERQSLKRLWESDFEVTSAAMPPERREQPVTWKEVETQLNAAVRRIRVVEINGSAGDALTYGDHQDGACLIAVGGDKLSRGLTLEGLSVSYYLRASKMYDTLLQMGRWFGYRPGYADLIRLYTTEELQRWYREIASANLELENKFDEMVRARSRPNDFSLYVRKSPAGLLVTASTKMRSGREMNLSFSGDVIETVTFKRDREVHVKNLQAVERLAEAAETQARAETDVEKKGSNLLWRGLRGEDIADFLEGFATSGRATKARSSLLARYIRSRLPHDGELSDWTLAIINNGMATAPSVTVAGYPVGLTKRTALPRGDSEDYAIRRVLSPVDELLDLSVAEYAAALALTQQEAEAVGKSKRPTEPTSQAGRKQRPASRGLLILYLLDPEGTAVETSVQVPVAIPPLDVIVPAFAVSFPHSPNAPTIKYMVPNRYWDKEA